MMFHAGRHGLMVLLAFAVANVAGLFAEVNAQPLRYNWRAGQKFSYQFDITVDGDDATTTYKGITNYTVDAASPEQMRVTYRGGLAESKTDQAKQPGSAGIRGPFGGPFGGPRGIPSPFSRPVFAGKTQTTNRITMTPRGSVLAMEGDSQLPYLLGNVSLLPFEALPEGTEREWSLDTGVSITEEDENRRHRFGPFDPFAGQDKKTVQAASEVARYSIQSASGNLVKITRSYNLTMPQTGDNPAFQMTGTGTWTFDQKEHVPHALDMNYKLTVKQGNTSTTIPISVKYTRISAAELARMEAAAKQASGRARPGGRGRQGKGRSSTDQRRETRRDECFGVERQRENHQDARPVGRQGTQGSRSRGRRRHREAPGQREQGDRQRGACGTAEMVSRLPAARRASPKPMKGLQCSSRPGWPWNRQLRCMSASLCNRSERTAVASGLQHKSRSCSRTARSSWVFSPGAKCAIQRSLPGATFSWLRRSSNSRSNHRVWQRFRRNSAPGRILTGRFKIEAEFVSIADGKVSLRRADNRVIAVPLDKLSAADQAYVQQLQQAENPFNVD